MSLLKRSIYGRSNTKSSIKYKYDNLVIKFAECEDIEREKEILLDLHKHNIPNCIEFLSDCLSDTSEKTLYNILYNIHRSIPIFTDPPGMIVMPYFSLGNLDEYRWDRSNFAILKNVLHQVAFTLLYAYETTDFVHRNMHIGNVLLQNSNKTTMRYGKRSLPVLGIYPLIMDFERSERIPNYPTAIYMDIDRFLSLSMVMRHSDIGISCKLEPLVEYILQNRPIDDTVYETIYNIIDQIEICYDMSEVSNMHTISQIRF